MQPPNLKRVLADALSTELHYTVPAEALFAWAQQFLVPELGTESRLFYGNGPDTTIERAYPGFDYANLLHRSWLEHYRFHAVFFRALDKCRFTDRDTRETCNWGFTFAHRHHVEQVMNVPIRDTLLDEVSEDPRRPGSPYAVQLATAPTSASTTAAPAADAASANVRPVRPWAHIRGEPVDTEHPFQPGYSVEGRPLGFPTTYEYHAAQVCFDRILTSENWRRTQDQENQPPRTLAHAHPGSARLRQEASESASANDAPDSPVTVIHHPPSPTASRDSLAIRGGYGRMPSVTPFSALADLDIESDDDEATGVELVARSVGTSLQRRLLAASEAGLGCEAVGAISPLWERWVGSCPVLPRWGPTAAKD